ncbi:MAG: WD40 repeat domain-containing protein [bacterium]
MTAAVSAHQDKARSVVFSPNGRLLASAGSDKIVQLWRFRAGQLELWKTNAKHKNGVWSLDFSPGGHLLATGAWDNTIHIWNFQTDQSSQFRGHRGPVLTVKFSPDGTRLASGSWDHSIRLWEVNSGRELDVIRTHKAPVKSVVFHPNGRLLVSGAEDQNLRLRDLSYLDAIALTVGDSARALRPQIAPGDTSGRFRDLIYLASTEFAQHNATHLPFQTAFRAYAYQLGYRLNDDNELVEEPLKFYWHVEDSTQVHFMPHVFLPIRQLRPLNQGPLQWSLESISAAEHSERRQASRWLSDILKRMMRRGPS